ncbi:TlpA family protein disulfide reductase [Micromonospora echinaurantiaca]|uniref:TlpA family protein disulfide reductase n=1 Tax=Micromonospora TaxID=1873 RepID=UPI00130548AA|nr:redoxin domain-containing protein [Micromonospora sp. S4605]
MSYLVAAVVVLAVLCVFNLLLSFGAIRRLRQHTELLNRPRHEPGERDLVRPVGSAVGEFVATTVDGDPVSRESVGAAALIAFFSVHCPACRERKPDFLAGAPAYAAAGWTVLAVVVGDPAESAALVTELRPSGAVLVEDVGGPVGEAFSLTGYPAFVLVRDSRIVASSFDLRQLPPAEAPAGSVSGPVAS